MYKAVAWTQLRVYKILPDGQLGEPVLVDSESIPCEVSKLINEKQECFNVGKKNMKKMIKGYNGE